MSRRNGMWMTLICILAVGGLATKMTRQLVVSEEAKPAAVLDVQSTEEEESESLEKEAAFVRAFAKMPEKETEPIKSPLDPATEKEEEKAASESEENLNVYETEELKKRLEKAEEKAGMFRKNSSGTNPGILYVMAERERLIWDRELSVISTSIRSRMSQEEAETFKCFELEWLKERDRAADGGMSRNLSAQGQDPDSARILAEKTRERCYLLVEEYEDILNRDGSGLQADAAWQESVSGSGKIGAQ